jgi:hypothetical protein
VRCSPWGREVLQFSAWCRWILTCSPWDRGDVFT